jgi:protein-tyrosine phosphatase
MIPLADIHCHLLAGLDDGPRTSEAALEMCRLAFEDGTRILAAGAHQSEHWPENSPERIRQASHQLAHTLREHNLPLSVFPCAEVMVQPDIDAAWRQQQLLSVADRGQYLLIEMPHSLFVDLREIVDRLQQAEIRPILAHPERSPELLHDDDAIEELMRLGCLVQVSAKSVTQPASRRDERALKLWFKRGIVHFLGSDGHSPRRRLPKLADAYQQVIHWAGAAVADRVASTNGTAVSQGLPFHVTTPAPRQKSWIPKLW